MFTCTDIAASTRRGNSFRLWSFSDLQVLIKITWRYFLLAEVSPECEESISLFLKGNPLEPVKRKIVLESVLLFFSFLFFSSFIFFYQRWVLIRFWTIAV